MAVICTKSNRIEGSTYAYTCYTKLFISITKCALNRMCEYINITILYVHHTCVCVCTCVHVRVIVITLVWYIMNA